MLKIERLYRVASEHDIICSDENVKRLDDLADRESWDVMTLTDCVAFDLWYACLRFDTPRAAVYCHVAQWIRVGCPSVGSPLQNMSNALAWDYVSRHQ